MGRRNIEYWVLVFFTIFFITACNQSPQSLLEKEQPGTAKQQQILTQPGETMSSNIVEEKELFQYRFYSPDKTQYISEHLDYEKSVGEPLPVKSQLYYGNTLIDTSSYPFGYEYKQKKAHVIWIDNKNIIINGIYIFNLERMTKVPIKFPEDFQNPKPILSYQLDLTGKTIALMTLDKQDNDLKGILNVSLYDLENNLWKSVFSKEVKWMPDWGYDSGINQLLWDNNGKLYFDYPVSNEYTQIVQYDSKTDKIVDLETGFKFFDASPDRKYFIIEKQEITQTGLEVTFYVTDSNTHQIVYKLPSNRYAWSTETSGELAMITYSSTELKSKNVNIELISLEERKTIKKITDDRFKVPIDTIALIDFHKNNYVLKIGEKSYLIKSGSTDN